MIIQNKPDYLIFADSAKKGENAEFPDVTRGWGVTIDQTASKPPMEWMNGAFNRIDKNMLYLLQQGVPEWSEQVTYPANAIIKYNGVLYTAIVENDNAIPTTSTTKWKKTQEEIPNASLFQKGVVKLNSEINSESETEAATPKAIKKVCDLANNQVPNIRKINNKTLNTDIVLQADDVNALPAIRKFDNNIPVYEVGGIQTDFKQRPTFNNSDLISRSDYSSSFNKNGYIKLPNGLVIQWGEAEYLKTADQDGYIQSFYTSFPHACLAIVTNDAYGGTNSTAAHPISTSQFRCWGKNSIGAYANTGLFYIALGF